MTTRRRHGTVVVTGAGTGIGAAVTRVLLGRGHDVLGLGLDADGTPTDVPQERWHRFLQVDVTDEQAVRDAFDRLDETPAPLHGLVTCAGIYPRAARLEDVTYEDWQRVLRVNLDGTFLACRAALPRLRRSGGGSVVTIASVHAVAAARGQPAYAASKAAVVGLTRQLAVDYAADGIRANTVVVGSVDTRITRAAIADAGSAEALNLSYDRARLGRIAEAGEVAEVVAFLLDEASSFVTASTLTADAGMTARIL